MSTFDLAVAICGPIALVAFTWLSLRFISARR